MTEPPLQPVKRVRRRGSVAGTVGAVGIVAIVVGGIAYAVERPPTRPPGPTDTSSSAPSPVTPVPVAVTVTSSPGTSPTGPPGDRIVPTMFLGKPLATVGDLAAELPKLKSGALVTVTGRLTPYLPTCDRSATPGPGEGQCPTSAWLLVAGDPSIRPVPITWPVDLPPPGTGQAIVGVEPVPDTGPRPAAVVRRILWHSQESRKLPGGAPREAAGEPVLTVGEALRIAAIAPSDASFLVGGWFGAFALRACSFPPTGACRLRLIGEEPFRAEAGGTPEFPVAPVEFPRDSPTLGAAYPAVLQVHARPADTYCGTHIDPPCQWVLMVDREIWQGPID